MPNPQFRNWGHVPVRVGAEYLGADGGVRGEGVECKAFKEFGKWCYTEWHEDKRDEYVARLYHL